MTTRTQATKLLTGKLKPILEKNGFMYQKKNFFWRVSSIKTDVVEIRFLLNNEPEKLSYPDSTFSIWGGCSFNFIPDIFETELIQKIANIHTPDIAHSHLKFTGVPTYRQSIFKTSILKPPIDLWHLDCEVKEAAEVLFDVEKVFIHQLLPIMNKFQDLQHFLALLENKSLSGAEFDIGKPDSLVRQYLLAFTYLQLKKYDAAFKAISEAKSKIDTILDKASSCINFNPEAPIIKQSEIINRTFKVLTLRN